MSHRAFPSTDLRAFPTAEREFPENFSLVSVVSSVASGGASTTYRSSITFGSVADGTVNEVYSLDGALPKIRFGTSVLGFTFINTVDDHYRWSWGTNVFSSDGIGRAAHVSVMRNTHNQVSANVDGYNTNDDYADANINTFNTDIYRFTVTSVSANNINVDGEATRTTSYAYRGIAWSGSLTAHTALLDTIPASIGASVLASLGFQPDIIYFQAALKFASGVNSEVVTDTYGFLHGIYDVRSTMARCLTHYYTNGAPDTITTVVDSWIVSGASTEPGMTYDVTSVSTAGFYLKCVSHGFLDNRIGFTAIKFDDPTIKVRVVDHTMPLSSGTETISLGFAPKYVHFLGTDNSTMGFYSTGNGLSYTQGFWAEGATPAAVYGWGEAANTSNLNHGDLDGYLAFHVTDSSRTAAADIRSITVQGSTNLQFYSNVPSTNGQNRRGFMLIVGVNEGGGGGAPTLTLSPTADIDTLNIMAASATISDSAYMWVVWNGTDYKLPISDAGKLFGGMTGIGASRNSFTFNTAYHVVQSTSEFGEFKENGWLTGTNTDVLVVPNDSLLKIRVITKAEKGTEVRLNINSVDTIWLTDAQNNGSSAAMFAISPPISVSSGDEIRVRYSEDTANFQNRFTNGWNIIPVEFK